MITICGCVVSAAAVIAGYADHSLPAWLDMPIMADGASAFAALAASRVLEYRSRL